MSDSILTETLMTFHREATKIARLLEESKYSPPDKYGVAVMLVVYPRESESPQPLGGSINYKDGKWLVDEQLELPQRVES